MKRLAALTLSGLLACAPAQAQEEGGGVKEGIDLLEEGARMFMRGLMDEMEPALRELAEGMEPALRRLLEIVDDFDAYHLPERLPNGDIILRRKTPLAPPEAPGAEETPPADGEIEL
ncbi:hypothetical protein [Actibacterium sp. MT2.3-13A]|uniref:hypothetical protein n=1 Tax=Actibacterium sp. MT2.3-13A TaxID=2828332 RepID=UPI001BA505AE|nr:hypothetical protein [Actibacterium sp. MT2.3-13A]